MRPIEFIGANVVFGKNQPEYGDLPAARMSDGRVMTCWELSEDEVAEVARTGHVWLQVLTFNQPIQPQVVSAFDPRTNIPTADAAVPTPVVEPERQGKTMRLKDLIEQLEGLHVLFGDVPVKFAWGTQDLEAVSTYISDDETVAWVDLAAVEKR
jgi:hypothetical protein